jgi:hypothetical protein
MTKKIKKSNHGTGHPTLVESGGSRNTRNLKVAATVAFTGARAEFLAGNPKAKKLQKAHLHEITTRIGRYRHDILSWATHGVKLANEAREIGLLIVSYLDTLPGKQMTLDLWMQLQNLFIDQYGNRITQETLKWFVKIAKANPDPFDSILDVLQWRQPLLLASGDETFQLTGERPQQVLHAPANPMSLLKDYFNPDLEAIVTELRANINYCPDGEHFRPDLCETLRVEMEPKLKRYDSARLWLRGELGI